MRRSTGSGRQPKGVEEGADRVRPAGAQVENMQKYYEIRDNSIAAMFSGEPGCAM